MDINRVEIRGTLATEGEIRRFESGTTLMRFLVTTRVTEPRRRVDVIPVTLWDPTDDQLQTRWLRDQRVVLTGSIQRRYWDSSDGRRSRLEVVADSIEHEEVTVA